MKKSDKELMKKMNQQQKDKFELEKKLDEIEDTRNYKREFAEKFIRTKTDNADRYFYPDEDYY